MTPSTDRNASLDDRARRLHQASLAHLSPQTLMRLRAARHAAQAAAPPRAGQWRWLTATAFTGVLAIGLGLQFLPVRAPPAVGEPAVPTPAPALSAMDASLDAVGGPGLLDEDPDLYLWLATAEAQPLAMESRP